ncbi:acyltransferase [Clostridium celatum]|uniref:acyltransferase family protein n=1 Tax=Clostridium celatum TaxID=36834 RepID=UPI00319E465C
MGNYIKEANYLKGLAILLMFIGHAATPTFLKRPLSYEIVVQFIYSFHMPLFFIVSGFLAVKSININFRNDYFLLLKKRIIKLGVPYVVIALITNIALNIASGNITINGFIESIKTTIFYPELGAMGALWFLYALLIISILTPIITKISLEASIIITIIINIFGPRDLYFLAINRISFFIVYYLIGMYVRKCYEDKKLKNINNKNIIIIGSVIFLGIYSLIISKGIVINRIIFNLYMFLCGLVGSLMMLLIIEKVKKCKRVISTVEIFGKYSMDIYIFSWFFQIISMILCTKILNISNYNIFFVSNLIIGSISLPFSVYFIRKIKILRIMFLGS